MVYYAYQTFVEDVKQLVKMSRDYQPDTIVAIARGGWMLGHAYASATDNRRLMGINSILYELQERGSRCEIFNTPDLSLSKRVLLMDDIIDSGQTMQEIVTHLRTHYPHIEIKIATLFYKPSAVMQADFTLHEAKEWIAFFWEEDYKDA